MAAIKLAALSGLAAVASAAGAVAGFNYASTSASGAAMAQSDFESVFNQAKHLVGTNGEFTSARLYTMIQAGSQSDVISAIPAAVGTNTRLLLGMWASAGQDGFNSELAALKAAAQQFGDAADLIDGLSVGSEDLYRITPTGIMNKAGIGAGPDTVANFIKQARQALAGTPWAHIPVGHVDTWTAWVNSSNAAVIQNADFLGLDAYPYFQPQDDNTPQNDPGLFNEALQKTIGVAGGKDVWVTETGYPVTGATSGQSVANTKNAQLYWDEVACKLLGSRNTWWYTLQDAPVANNGPSFGVATSGSTTPLYDLSCKNVGSSTSSSSAKSSSYPTSTASAPVKAQSSSAAMVSSGMSSQQTSVLAAASSTLTAVVATSGAATGPSASIAPAAGGAPTTPASAPVSTPTATFNNGAGRVGVSMGALAAVGAVAMLL